MSFYELKAEQTDYFNFEKRSTAYLTRTHFHGAIELLFVKEGKQEVIVGGEHAVLSTGDACIAESFIPHSYGKPEGEVYVLLGEKKYFDEVFNKFGKKHPPRFFRFENAELLEYLYQLCLKEYKNPINRSTVFDATIKILLSEIAETTQFVDMKKDAQNDLIREILQYANDHPLEDLNLHTLAKKFGYTHEYLSRLLHKQLSENWKSYVNRLRVRIAERLLHKNNSDTILQIAFNCGFDSIHTFYRAYKKEFGKLPRRN